MVVALVPLLDRLPVTREQRATAPQLTSSLARSVPSGGVVLVFPYPRAHNDEPMLWQAVDEMSFRIVGGYALVPGTAGGGGYYVAQGPELSELSSLLAGRGGLPQARPLGLCQPLEAVVHRYTVAALVLRPGPGAAQRGAIRLLSSLLGPPTVSFQAGVAWYDLPGRHLTRDCAASS